MKRPALLWQTLALLLLAAPATAAPEAIVAGLSQNRVSITADFDGSEILIYGAVKRDAPAPAGAPSLPNIPSLPGAPAVPALPGLDALNPQALTALLAGLPGAGDRLPAAGRRVADVGLVAAGGAQ